MPAQRSGKYVCDVTKLYELCFALQVNPLTYYDPNRVMPKQFYFCDDCHISTKEELMELQLE